MPGRKRLPEPQFACERSSQSTSNLRPVIAGVKRAMFASSACACRCCWWLSRGDVLLARAERETQRRLAARILGHADDATGHLTFEFVARGEERGVRSAVAKRHTKALCAANRDVRAEFAGGLMSVSASKSVATVSIAPAAWALAAKSEKCESRRSVGYCTSAPKTFSLNENVS